MKPIESIQDRLLWGRILIIGKSSELMDANGSITIRCWQN